MESNDGDKKGVNKNQSANPIKYFMAENLTTFDDATSQCTNVQQ